MGDHHVVTRKRRALLAVLAFVLALTGCGDDGETDEQREAVVQILERLGKSRVLSECIAEEWEGLYVADDLQPLIDSLRTNETVDFKLVEDLVSAEATCS